MADLRHKRHIFFDLDDTLWDFEKNSSAVLSSLFEEYSLEQKLGAGFSTFMAHYREVNLALWSQYYRREISKEYLRNERFQLVFKRLGYDNYDENLEITGQYLQRAPKGTCLKDSCTDILSYLSRNYRLHIITNGFKEIQHIKIDGCGLRHYFDHIIISEEHGFVKPQEQIFRLAESVTGASRAQCVMIGDSFESDVSGALNAGWDAIHLTASPAAGYQGYHIAGLSELRKFF